MRGKKAKLIRKKLFERGIGIEARPYSVQKVNGKKNVNWVLHASEGRKLYQKTKKES